MNTEVNTEQVETENANIVTVSLQNDEVSNQNENDSDSSEEVEENDDEEEEISEDDSETSEDDESEDDEEEEGEEEKDKVKKRKGNRFKKRIAGKNKRISQLELDNEMLKRQLLEAKGQKKDENPESATKQTEDGKPNPDDFDTFDEYAEALTDWKVDQKLSAHEKKTAKKQAETSESQRRMEIGKQFESFKSEHPDFDDLMEDAEDIVIADQGLFNEVVFQSKNAPAILYELAKNHKEATRIGKLTGYELVKEIGKFEDKILSKTQTRTTKKKTKTPRPISSTVRGGAKFEKSLSDPNLTQAEYEALRRKQREQRGRY